MLNWYVWVKLVCAALLSGFLMGFFMGFKSRESHVQVGTPVEEWFKTERGTSFGNWVRAWKVKLYKRFAGWRVVAITLAGGVLGMFGPLYVFFGAPIMPDASSGRTVAAIYLVLSALIMKFTNLL